jgi:hypothetical protein
MLSKALLVLIGVVVLVLIGLRLANQGHRIQVKDAETGELRWVDPATLKMGPVRDTALTPAQLERIGKLHDRLVQIDGWPLEKRVDLFARDLDPDKELDVYDRIVGACDRAFAKLGALTPEQKREVYALLVVVSTASPDEVLKRYAPKALTREQVEATVSTW